MRSAAKLSYQQAQAAIDGRADETTGPLLAPVLEPLYAAYRALEARARRARAARSRPCPSARSSSTPDGTVDRVVMTPERLDAHRLIEEFMILANVAAAETLERAHTAADLSGARRARHGTGQCAARIPADARHLAAQGGRAACRAVQPHPRPGEGPRGRETRQRGGAAHPGAGRVRRRELRPFRAQPAPLRAFHLADPPLCRSGRAPRADPRAASSATARCRTTRTCGPWARSQRPSRPPSGAP